MKKLLMAAVAAVSFTSACASTGRKPSAACCLQNSASRGSWVKADFAKTRGGKEFADRRGTEI